MPLYNVQHATPLTAAQQDSLASAITKIHSERFTTPRLFVNVEFHDVRQATTYIGGKRATGNHIRANVRSGPSRTQADWDALCEEVEAAWEEIVVKAEPLPVPKGKTGGAVADTTLRSVIVLGGLIAGREAGFVLPQAGGDVQWLKENWEEFNRKANAGDEDMKDMVQEIKERGLMDRETNGFKNAAKSLEEM